VVTKCEPSLTIEEKEKLVREIHPKKGQLVFFTSIQYDTPYQILTGSGCSITDETSALLVTGIANPAPLKAWLEKNSREYNLLQYSDHHIFTIDDLNEMKRKFDGIEGSNRIILTTEKDAVRLLKFGSEIKDWPLYVLPVRHDFLFGEQQSFDQSVHDFIQNFK